MSPIGGICLHYNTGMHCTQIKNGVGQRWMSDEDGQHRHECSCMACDNEYDGDAEHVPAYVAGQRAEVGCHSTLGLSLAGRKQ